MVNCLNGPLCRRRTRHKHKLLGNDGDHTDPEYHLQIGQPNDNSNVNITVKYENSKLINCYANDKKKSNESIYCDVLIKWNQRMIPDFGVERKYKAIAPTMIQSHDEKDEISSYNDTWCEFIIPTYDGHWRLIYVEMLDLKRSNRMVKHVDHSPQRAKSGYQSHISATMWYTNFLVLCGNIIT